MESELIAKSHLGSSVLWSSSPCAGLQLVTQSTHLSKDCYSQLVLNQFLYFLAKVSFALQKPWVKHFVNLPIEWFFITANFHGFWQSGLIIYVIFLLKRIFVRVLLGLFKLFSWVLNLKTSMSQSIKASHKDDFLRYLQSFRTRFSQEQLQLLLANTTK